MSSPDLAFPNGNPTKAEGPHHPYHRQGVPVTEYEAWHLVEPPDDQDTVDNVIPLKPEIQHSGQLRISEKFRDWYSHKLLYVHGIGWHHWAGTHWVEDEDGKVRRRVIAALKKLRHEAVDMRKKEDGEALLKDVKTCETNGGVTGILDLARHMHPMTVSVKNVNTNPYLFNALNGTLNLETGELQPHNPRDMITKCAGTIIDPDATDALWDDFLEQVLPEEDIRSYLQRVFGVALLGVVREHNLPILTGTGGNGKGVCYAAVLAAFGDYGITVDPQLIMQTKHERHATFLADLHGARLVVTSETNQDAVIAASTVKRLTGGDKIRANRMRENTFEFAPSHSLIYITNHKPKVSADDKAMWRRLSVIPFDVKVADPDTRLPEKLNGVLPAVLAWVYQGWLDYQEQGLNAPAAVLDCTETYRAESDPCGLFLSEVTVSNQYASVQATKLYQEWQSWAAKQGHPPMTQTDFGRRMKDRNLQKGEGRKARFYVGIGLVTDETGALPMGDEEGPG
jgi:putative DNA primase/helicase